MGTKESINDTGAALRESAGVALYTAGFFLPFAGIVGALGPWMMTGHWSVAAFGALLVAVCGGIFREALVDKASHCGSTVVAVLAFSALWYCVVTWPEIAWASGMAYCFGFVFRFCQTSIIAFDRKNAVPVAEDEKGMHAVFVALGAIICSTMFVASLLSFSTWAMLAPFAITASTFAARFMPSK